MHRCTTLYKNTTQNNILVDWPSTRCWFADTLLTVWLSQRTFHHKIYQPRSLSEDLILTDWSVRMMELFLQTPNTLSIAALCHRRVWKNVKSFAVLQGTRSHHVGNFYAILLDCYIITHHQTVSESSKLHTKIPKPFRIIHPAHITSAYGFKMFNKSKENIPGVMGK